MVEGEAQLEQEPALEDARGDRRVADGPEEDRVVGADRREVLLGEGLAGACQRCAPRLKGVGLTVSVPARAASSTARPC